jgi:hypothetical protein
LAHHSITQQLRNLGATDEQLAGMRFRNQKGPFEQWSFTWTGPGHPPVKVMALTKAYSALKWLLLDDPPPSRDRDAAFAYLAMTMAAPEIDLAARFKSAQKAKARLPRGRVDDEGRTISQIIIDLCSRPDHRNQRIGELWDHFLAELHELRLDPTVIPSTDPRKVAYEYNVAARRKRISFGRFANIASSSGRRRTSH